MAVNYFICLLSKLDDSITELTRMASSSRDVIVNKKGNAMCLVFVHGSAVSATLKVNTSLSNI